MFLVGLGEVLNFTAYMFAPASLVTPLGTLERNFLKYFLYN